MLQFTSTNSTEDRLPYVENDFKSNICIRCIFYRMRCYKIYTFTEEKIGVLFEKYGRFVSRHAWKIIILTVVINCGLAIGVINLKSDIDAENIYLPRGKSFVQSGYITKNRFCVSSFHRTVVRNTLNYHCV